MKNIKKYAIIAIFLAVLIVPNVSSADTIAGLQAQINSLLAQIQQLQKQLAQLQGQPATWCHDFNTNLKVGDQGDEIEALHTALEKEGFNVFATGPDASVSEVRYFSEKTASAVSGFQQKYKDEILTPLGLQYGTGYVGEKTRAKLNKLYGCEVKPTPPPFCAQSAVICSSDSKIICPAGLNEKGCPFPCKCVPIIAPSITVLSPNGGEIWERGQSYTIKWSSSGVSIVVIDLLRKGADGIIRNYKQIASQQKNYDQYYGNFTWTVPNDIETGNGYSIRVASGSICPEGTTCYADVSNAAFSIVAAGTTSCVDSDGGWNLYSKGETKINNLVVCTDRCATQEELTNSNGQDSLYECFCGNKEGTGNGQGSGWVYCPFGCSNGACVPTPSITVLSPNGGEKWEIGKSYQIKWSSPTLGDNKPLRISLTDINTKYSQIITDTTNVNGYYNWTIPSNLGGYMNLGAGNVYKVGICYDCFGGSNKYDESDAAFSIVGAGTPVLFITPDATFPTTNILAGSSNAEVGRFLLSNNNVSDVKIASIYIKRNNIGSCAFQNLKLYSGTTQIGSTITALDTNCGALFNLLLTIPKSTTEIISLRADVPASMKADTLAFQIAGISGDPINVIWSGIPTTSNGINIVTPSITVLSPNGGERWAQGVNHVISWKGGSCPTANLYGCITVSLHKVEGTTGYHVGWLGTGAPNGSLNWDGKLACDSLPLANAKCSSVVPGTYQIMISDGTNLDTSDAPFSIVAAGTNLPDLVVSNFSAPSYSIPVNQKVRVTLGIKNIGNAPATPVDWKYTNQSDGFSYYVSNSCAGITLNTGETCQVVLDFTFPTSGSKLLNVLIDQDNKITESDEKNNTGGLTLNVTSALKVEKDPNQPTATLASQGATNLPFTKVKFINNTSSDIAVNGLKIERTGLANDAVFASIALLDENGWQIGSVEKLDLNHQTILNGLTVRAGETRTVIIAGNMASNLSGYGGQMAYLTLMSVILDPGVNISGTLPITGTGHTVYAGNLSQSSQLSQMASALESAKAFLNQLLQALKNL